MTSDSQILESLRFDAAAAHRASQAASQVVLDSMVDFLDGQGSGPTLLMHSAASEAVIREQEAWKRYIEAAEKMAAHLK